MKREPLSSPHAALAAELERRRLARLVAAGRFIEAVRSANTVTSYQQLAQPLKYKP